MGGNRVGKVVYDGADVTKTWYIRDAQGNIMATYEEQNDTLTWTEQHIYGSSRLGYWQPDSMMYPKPTLPATDTFRYVVRAGDKLYEISNHLGNVLASITDRKIPQETGTPNGIADYYLADIATVQDYYPFGMVMPGRNWKAGTASGYGFGFNGKLKDDEIKGNSNSLDFGARVYDSRIGRWVSVDPLNKIRPDLNPYSGLGNNPIIFIDPDGKVIKPASDQEQQDIAMRLSALFGASLANFIEYSVPPNGGVIANVSNGFGGNIPVAVPVFRVVTNNPDLINSDDPSQPIKYGKFKSALKNQNVKLSKKDKKTAYAYYKAAASQRIYEIGVFDNHTTVQNSALDQLTGGTNVVTMPLVTDPHIAFQNRLDAIEATFENTNAAAGQPRFTPSDLIQVQNQKAALISNKTGADGVSTEANAVFIDNNNNTQSLNDKLDAGIKEVIE